MAMEASLYPGAVEKDTLKSRKQRHKRSPWADAADLSGNMSRDGPRRSRMRSCWVIEFTRGKRSR
jgi:hypothetical protein